MPLAAPQNANKGATDHGVDPTLLVGMNTEQLSKRFDVNVEDGLSASEVAVRAAEHGPNTLPKMRPPGVLRLLFNQFRDMLVLILLIVGIVSLGLGKIAEGVVLLTVVAGNVAIGFHQEYGASRAIAALSSLSVPTATVVRDGVFVEIPSPDLVPGDVITLDEGDIVPADARLVQSFQLTTHEALLTGESEPVAKVAVPQAHAEALGSMRNMCFKGTMVLRGRGIAIVTATGSATEMGRIVSMVISAGSRGADAAAGSSSLGGSGVKPPEAAMSPAQDLAPIQLKLRTLGRYLVAFGALLCLVIFALGIGLEPGSTRNGSAYMRWVKVSIALAVAVVPEGLVVVVTITMAVGVQRMARRHALARRLTAVETLGSVTVIASDKTGTLTEGRMSAVALWTPQDLHRSVVGGPGPSEAYLVPGMNSGADGIAPPPSGTSIAPLAAPPADLSGLMAVSMLCLNATTEYDPAARLWGGQGDSTEVALAAFAARMRRDGDATAPFEGMVRVFESPFSSETKRMTIACKVVDGQACDSAAGPQVTGTSPLLPASGTALVMVKGAVEVVVSMCSDVQVRESALAAAAEMSRRGLRVLAVGVKTGVPLSAVETLDPVDRPAVEALEGDLFLCGLVGLLDPPRAEVRAAIEACHRAGITVVMITGDHPQTALAIAEQLAIVESAATAVAVTGAELQKLSPDELAEREPFPRVFARVDPSHKLMIVQALQGRGNTVAMTGDGANDAAAIKCSDVGIAMGISGTDLTKDASDVVLLDDNFTTIIEAVREGRCIYDNILRFTRFLLSCNASYIGVVLVAVIARIPVPFTPMAILLANLIVDVVPALALGLDDGAEDVMLRAPRPPKAPILDLRAVCLIAANGLSMSAMSLGAYLFAIYSLHIKVPVADDESPNEARTVSFIVIATLHAVHALVARFQTASTLRLATFNNRVLDGAVLLSTAVLYAAMYIPRLNHELTLYPLPGRTIAVGVVAIVGHLLVTDGIKFVVRAVWGHRKG